MEVYLDVIISILLLSLLVMTSLSGRDAKEIIKSNNERIRNGNEVINTQKKLIQSNDKLLKELEEWE